MRVAIRRRLAAEHTKLHSALTLSILEAEADETPDGFDPAEYRLDHVLAFHVARPRLVPSLLFIALVSGSWVRFGAFPSRPGEMKPSMLRSRRRSKFSSDRSPASRVGQDSSRTCPDSLFGTVDDRNQMATSGTTRAMRAAGSSFHRNPGAHGATFPL